MNFSLGFKLEPGRGKYKQANVSGEIHVRFMYKILEVHLVEVDLVNRH